jgi:hypothetical protein
MSVDTGLRGFFSASRHQHFQQLHGRFDPPEARATGIDPDAALPYFKNSASTWRERLLIAPNIIPLSSWRCIPEVFLFGASPSPFIGISHARLGAAPRPARANLLNTRLDRISSFILIWAI